MMEDSFTYTTAECLLWVGSILDAGYTSINKADMVLAHTVRKEDINQTHKYLDNCSGEHGDKDLAFVSESV